MKLGTLSTKSVVCVAPEDSVGRAAAIMEERGVHHLPVLAAGEVVGMVSDRDLLMLDAGQNSGEQKSAKEQASGSPRVADIMSHPVVTLSPDDALRSATWLMVTHRVHAIPLIRGDRLVGLVTETDLLRGVIASRAFSQPHQQAFLQQPVMSHVRGRLTTVEPSTSLNDIVDIMRKKRIRHLPVVDDSELLGIVSDRDVRRALGRATALDAQAQEAGEFFLGPSEAREIMTKTVRTITSSATISSATEELLRHQIHCLPVVEHGELLGLITDTDLLRAIGAADKEDALQQP